MTKEHDAERSVSAGDCDGASRTGSAAVFETEARSMLGEGDDLQSESWLLNGIATGRGFNL